MTDKSSVMHNIRMIILVIVCCICLLGIFYEVRTIQTINYSNAVNTDVWIAAQNSGYTDFPPPVTQDVTGEVFVIIILVVIIAICITLALRKPERTSQQGKQDYQVPEQYRLGPSPICKVHGSPMIYDVPNREYFCPHCGSIQRTVRVNDD